MGENVKLERDAAAGVAVIRLDRPPVNALSTPMMGELGDICAELADDLDVRSVVVTGAGWVTPLGHDIDSVWTRLLNAESAVAPITHFDASTFATNFAAEVSDFNLSDFFDDSNGTHDTAGRSTQFALAACHNAFKQSRLDTNPIDPTRIGVYLGAGEGVLDYEPYMAANVAAWDHDARAFNPKTWADDGAADAWSRAKAKAQVVLAAHHPAYLTPEHDAGIRAAFKIMD